MANNGPSVPPPPPPLAGMTRRSEKKAPLSLKSILVFRPPKNGNDINPNLRLNGSYSVEELIKTDIKEPKEITEKTTDLFQKCLIEKLRDQKDTYPDVLVSFLEEVKGIFQSLCEDKGKEKEISQTIAIDMLLTALPSKPNPESFGLEDKSFDHFYTNEKAQIAPEQKKQIINYAFREKERIKLLGLYLDQGDQIKTNFDEFKKDRERKIGPIDIFCPTHCSITIF